jgi:hypothetical protein
MSSTASTSNPKETTSAAEEPAKEENAPPTLGVLEEDDEFEEFPVQGALCPFSASLGLGHRPRLCSNHGFQQIGMIRRLI